MRGLFEGANVDGGRGGDVRRDEDVAEGCKNVSPT